MTQPKKYAVGIDGGGTKSIACLIDSNGALCGRVRFAPTNFRDGQETGIAARIRAAVRDLDATPGERCPDTLAACLSGLGREAPKARVAAELSRARVAAHVLAESDAMAALDGAFAGGPGIIILAGTGSIAFGKSAKHEIFRCGGWGYLFGDEGSGFDIGRRVVARALQGADGRGPATSLQQRLEAQLGMAPLTEAVTRLYAGFSGRGEVAQLALLAFEEAEKGDAVARQIVQQAACELAGLALGLLEKMPPQPRSLPLALVGNLFNNSGLAAALERELQRAKAPVRRMAPRFPPEIGAALLAFAAIGIRLPETVLAKLQSELQRHAVT